MTTIVICAGADLEPELSHTLFWRDDLERYVAERAEEARMLVLSTEPHVVVIDRDMPGAAELVASLRSQTLPHPITIVALSHVAIDADGDESGPVDAVLPLPPSSDWDARLDQILQVPTRKQARFDVRFEIETLLRHEPVVRAGVALNMSAGGVLVECVGLGLPGDDVELRMSIPGLSAAVKGRARVVRSPVAEHRGLRFEAFTGDGDARVREFVASLATRHA